MSKKFNSIKKGLTEAIEDADGGTLGTRIHRPHLSLPLFSQPEQVDENSSQVCEWRLAMNKRKISIEDFKNNRALNFHTQKSKEVAGALDAKSETLPYSKIIKSKIGQK
jgi:hypothetical protein